MNIETKTKTSSKVVSFRTNPTAPSNDCPLCKGTGCYSEHVQQPDGHFAFVLTMKCACKRFSAQIEALGMSQCGLSIEDMLTREQLARQVRLSASVVRELQKENLNLKRDLDIARSGGRW